MKKNLILTAVLAIGTMIAVNANSVGNFRNTNDTVAKQDTTVKKDSPQQADEYKSIKFEELNLKVQAAIRGLVEKYNLHALDFNAKKQITRVKASLKTDKSDKTFYFDIEGVEINEDGTKVEKAQENKQQEAVTPSPEAATSFSNDSTQQKKQVADEFKPVKFEELNPKVQAAVKGLVEKYDLNALDLNAKKQITRVKATLKEDKSDKTFYFDVEGKEVNYEESEK